MALPAPLVEALRAHRTAQLEERVAAGSLWQDHDLVFAQPNGRPIERKSDWRAWKAILSEADLCDVRQHDGRHTAAPLLLIEGVHPPGRHGGPGPRTDPDDDGHHSHVAPALGRDAANRMTTRCGTDLAVRQPTSPLGGSELRLVAAGGSLTQRLSITSRLE